MGMRDINNTKLTICEVLRCINDRLQGKQFTDERDMLALAEQMAKKMIAKLVEYNQENDRGWWEKNPQYIEKINRSMQNYLAGNPENAKLLLQAPDYNRGLVMIVFGKDYDRVAAQTVAISRKNIQCPITILTNLKNRCAEWRGIRNINFVELDIPTNENRRIKIELYKYSPYRETIYLDCDAIVKKPGIEKMFDYLNDSDIVFQRYSTWQPGKKYFRIYCNAVKTLNCNLPINIYVGGFWAFRNGNDIEILSKQWIENWNALGCGRDMPALACAIQQTKIKHEIISRDSARLFSVNIKDDTVVVHRKCRDDMNVLGIKGYRPNKPFDKNRADWELVYFDGKMDDIKTHPWVLQKYENDQRRKAMQYYVNKYIPEILIEGKKFLDIATGPGDVMEIANNAGCISSGIEFNLATKEKNNEYIRVEYIKLMHAERKLNIIYCDFNDAIYGKVAILDNERYDIINCQGAINIIAGINDPLAINGKKTEDCLFQIKRDENNLYHNDGEWVFNRKYDEFYNLFFVWCRNHLANDGVLMLATNCAKNQKENSIRIIDIAGKNGFVIDICDRDLNHKFRLAA